MRKIVLKRTRSDQNWQLQPVVNWGKEWLVHLNTSKTKLLSINHLKDPFFFLPPICMADANLHKSDTIHLVGLMFSDNMKWKDYIESIAGSVAKKTGSLCRARQFVPPESVLHIYKSSMS